MPKGLTKYGAEDKITVMDETVIKMREIQANFTNPLSF